VHLDERGDAGLGRERQQRLERSRLERPDNQQDRIGAGGRRLQDLVALDDEILAQQRHANGRPNRFQVRERAVEKRGLREHRDRRRPGCRVGPRMIRRVVLLPQDPARRRSPLALRDHARRGAVPQRPHEPVTVGPPPGGDPLLERSLGHFFPPRLHDAPRRRDDGGQ
jgi:hypothetical protein